jgi:L-seryl-tRNA(Ser) seleniumtransferase
MCASQALQRIDSMTLPSAYRNIPSVNELAESSLLAQRAATSPRSVIVDCVRQVLDEYRTGVSTHSDPQTFEQLVDQVLQLLDRVEQSALVPVINATGVILHTGLGRSPLADAAVKAVHEAAKNYTSLEIDLETGKRGSRSAIVRDLLCQLTGAEAATVVNNNAGATLLMLNTIARDLDVIVSRGELIEIGGSFRLPQIMEASSAKLREVGTTNKTRLSDYADAIVESTAALLKVHTSNYRVVGFTEQVPIDELVSLGREHKLAVIDDIGSGALNKRDSPLFVDGPGEPTAVDSIAAGADLVLFSGDKLLGGPQAGIIIGKKKWIDRIEKNPMMRALRLDKLTLAALQATLQLHRDPQKASQELPIMAMANTPLPLLRSRAERIVEQIGDIAAVCDTTAYLGGGSMPEQGLPSVAVRITPHNISETQFAQRLRNSKPPIITRIAQGCLWLDMRTIFDRQDQDVINALKEQL